MCSKQQAITARPQVRCQVIRITQLGILEVAIELNVRRGYADEFPTKKIYKHQSAKKSNIKQP
jgi:hypothetical protein